jgi:Tol biopolymer transport system component
LTFDPYQDVYPLWSPDGLRILYSNNRSGSWDLYIKDSGGAGKEEILLKLGGRILRATSSSKDGRFVMYTVGGPAEKNLFDLWIAPQFGGRKPYPYLQTRFNEVDGVFSPDGRWVAYSSDESGRYEVYVQAFPLSKVKFQVSTGGGSEPSWRKDSAELFFLAPDRNIMAVPVKSGATFEAGAPKPLFRTSSPAAGPSELRVSYAVSNDGQGFLAASRVGDENAPRITVVLNWQTGLKK